MALRDGVELSTDIYLPASGGRVPSEPMPGLLRRTPYNKGGGKAESGMRLARCGYMVAIQDVRGRFESDGEFNAFDQEAEDGYDAIEWLAAQSECDGRVGTFGGSYEAYAQASAATQSPPHLAAMCHTFGYPHGYHSVRQGGALDIFWLSYFVMMAGNGKEALADPAIEKALLEMRFDEWLAHWPIREGQSPLSLAPSYERTYFNYLRHECLDDFWRRPGLSPAEHLDRWPDVPTLWFCGWFDHYPYCDPDTLAFTRLIEMGYKNQYVVFGPWTHGDMGRQIGHTTFGEASQSDVTLPDFELRWFDRWFKGVDDDGLFSSRARYFTMGGGEGNKTEDGLLRHGGEWQETDLWPPSEASSTPYYFQAGGQLMSDAPIQGDSSVTYTADPDDPVPSSTGVCYTVARMAEGGSRRISTNGAWEQVEGPHLFGVEPPYLPLCSRNDVVVFQTEPLEHDLEVTGHPVVELWVSTDAPDADFVAKLIDVYPPSEDYPCGFALGVSEGVRRAKFRNGFEQPEPLTPGEIYRIRIELRPLSNLFRAGHRLRVDLTSSSFPHFDVNTHTGRNPSDDYERRIAQHTIYLEKGHPSRILLPVMAGA